MTEINERWWADRVSEKVRKIGDWECRQCGAITGSYYGDSCFYCHGPLGPGKTPEQSHAEYIPQKKPVASTPTQPTGRRAAIMAQRAKRRIS